MPTAAAVRQTLRRFLDDFETDHRKGLMWSDAEINLALNIAQFATCRWLYIKGHWHLLDKLVASVSSTGATPVNVPANYMFAGSAFGVSPSSGVEYPSALYMGDASLGLVPAESRYTAIISTSTISFFKAVTPIDGVLTYYEEPTQFAASTNHTDFIDPVYDVIIYHAAALLQQKDWGMCRRALENLKYVLERVIKEPPGTHQPSAGKESGL